MSSHRVAKNNGPVTLHPDRLQEGPGTFFRTLFLGSALALGCAALSGCSSLSSMQPSVPIISQLFASDASDVTRALWELEKITYDAADKMLAQITKSNDPFMDQHLHAILPASFVENRNLDQSSAIGRLMAQQVASRFVQAGYPVLEIKLRRSIGLIRGEKEGQFLLSRELEKVAETQEATSVLVGSYVATRNHLYVNSQLIALETGIALASQDFKIPLTFELRDLLLQGT